MMHHIEYTEGVLKQLKKLDKSLSAMLYAWIEKNLVNSEDPQTEWKRAERKRAYSKP